MFVLKLSGIHIIIFAIIYKILNLISVCHISITLRHNIVTKVKESKRTKILIYTTINRHNKRDSTLKKH